MAEVLMKNRLSVVAFWILGLVMGVASPLAWAASSPIRVTVHVPSKSLSVMPYYFGKDKNFFAPELRAASLSVSWSSVACSPPPYWRSRSSRFSTL
jgi:hypothetical protein